MSDTEGKVVTHFLYKPDDAPKATEMRIPVKLRQTIDREKVTVRDERLGLMVKKPGKTRKAEFFVELDDGKGELASTDIEVLRKGVFERLDAKHALPWVEHLLVEVKSRATYTGQGESFDVRYDTVYVATLPDGSKLHKSDRWKGTDVRKGLPFTGDDDRGTVTSLIEATPANVKAMEAFLKGMKRFRNDLVKFLSPDVIQANLLTGAKLLVGSTTEGTTDGKPAGKRE